VQEHATALGDAIERALPGWIERSIAKLGPGVDARPAVEAALAHVLPRVRSLIAADVDEQHTTPLALLRDAVPFMTDALRAATVPPVDRDDFERDRFPDDDYGLTPASWADVDPSLVEPGIAWGAAKAWTHKRRHATAEERR
ncbi:MAG TPA: hypothetical protein VF230_08995, partial [Acidimicrobiales bacterium]